MLKFFIPLGLMKNWVYYFLAAGLLATIPAIARADYLYHGSHTDNIEILEPRRRYRPGNEDAPPEAVYAARNPAYAAAHAFPWASSEGIDLYFDFNSEGQKFVVIEIPEHLMYRLAAPVFIYTVPEDSFTLCEHSNTGDDYRSLCPVICLEKMRFESAIKAILHYGGAILVR